MSLRPTFFRIQSLCLEVLGANVSKERNSKWNYIRSSFNCFISSLLLITQLLAVPESINDLEVLLHLLGLIVGVFLSVIKIFAMHFQVDNFVEMNCLLTALSTNVSPADRKKLMWANRVSQTFSFVNIFCLLTSTLTLILYPLGRTMVLYFLFPANRDSLVWPVPFDATFPFDTSTSPNYELVYIFTLYSFIVASCSINAIDSMFVEACLLLVCHFKFLQRNVENLDYANFKEEFGKIFNYHRRILVVKTALQKAYSWILPCFVIIAPTMFGLFVISALRSPGVTVFKSLGYAISTLCQIFFYTYGGDIIHQESEAIVNCYFLSNWYEAETKKRKEIVTAMILAQDGTRIKAGLLELSLTTFARILSSTFSLITVLSSVFD